MRDRAEPYDLLVVGGGINGASIARAAAVADKRVILVEQGDLAQATSSASTKLMHGGLRYLEYYEFKLVREALNERAIMLRTAPHLVRPLEFRLPHAPEMRPWPIVRLGLWLYDMLALGGGLPKSRAIRLDEPDLKANGARGFSYWDGWVDDARLVVLNAVDAEEAGAKICTRTRLLSARRGKASWTAMVQAPDGESEIEARILVNAAGPWVEDVLAKTLGRKPGRKTRLVKGSHIIVERRLGGDHAWLLQQPDGRVVFAIPYLGKFTLIGTTDVAVDNPDAANISSEEVEYLLSAANRYLADPVGHNSIVGHYSGVRPLADDGAGTASAVSRDYRLELDSEGAPLLSIFGGKITTARHLAEVALKRLGIASTVTRRRALPGGDIADFDAFLVSAQQAWPFLGQERLKRLAGAYGTRIGSVLGDATSTSDLGRDFGHGLCEREVDYLVQSEWASNADDILWRRTKLGYWFDPAQVVALNAYLGRPT